MQELGTSKTLCKNLALLGHTVKTERLNCTEQRQWCTTNAKQKQYEKTNNIFLIFFLLLSHILLLCKSTYNSKLLCTCCDNLQCVGSTENSLPSQTSCKSLANTKQKAYSYHFFFAFQFYFKHPCAVSYR